jgi:hypothetical protein
LETDGDNEVETFPPPQPEKKMKSVVKTTKPTDPISKSTNRFP